MSTAVTKRRIGVISTVVVALVASLLVWLATRSEGEVARKADLNDGGIWVTNSEQSRFGRINKAAGQLDAGVYADVGASSGLDMYQDGAAVVGYTKASNQVIPINPSEGTLRSEQAVLLPKASTATGNRVFTPPPIDLRGGSIAMIDPVTGDLRVQHVDDRGGVTGLEGLQTQAKPVAKVGGNAAVAVGVDGTVYALSAEKGTVTVVRPKGDAFDKPVTTELKFSSKSAQITAVGAHWVVWDSGTGKLYSDALAQPQQLSVGSAEPGNPAFAALQQPGPDASTVLIQDEAQLSQVSLTGDSQTTGGVKLSQGAPGQQLLLSAPVRLANCVHAAWAGPSDVYYGRNCGSPTDADTVDLGAMKKGVRTDGVKLRVNRGLIVLNDLDSGDVWDVDRDKVKIDNWELGHPAPAERQQEHEEGPEPPRRPADPDAAQGAAGRHAGAAGPDVHAARPRQRLRQPGLDPGHRAGRRDHARRRGHRGDPVGRRADRPGDGAPGAGCVDVLVQLHRQQRHVGGERARHGQGHGAHRRPRRQHPPAAARGPVTARVQRLPRRGGRHRQGRGHRRLA